MISIDEQKERQVWSRVMNTAVSCPKPEEPKQDTGLTEKTLAQMIQCEYCEAAIYRSLAAQGPKCARERLLRLAEDERCHAKQLGALYFLMTGKKYCPEPVRGLLQRGAAEAVSGGAGSAGTICPAGRAGGRAGVHVRDALPRRGAARADHLLYFAADALNRKSRRLGPHAPRRSGKPPSS